MASASRPSSLAFSNASSNATTPLAGAREAAARRSRAVQRGRRTRAAPKASHDDGRQETSLPHRRHVNSGCLRPLATECDNWDEPSASAARCSTVTASLSDDTYSAPGTPLLFGPARTPDNHVNGRSASPEPRRSAPDRPARTGVPTPKTALAPPRRHPAPGSGHAPPVPGHQWPAQRERGGGASSGAAAKSTGRSGSGGRGHHRT